MPIYECDPWREQYFEAVDCPPDVHIPTDDVDAHRLHPRHRWIYDKLVIARSQGIDCGPHEEPPRSFPVFSKPIVNLKGMGIGSRVLRSESDYLAHREPGHFWMTLLTGEHVSTDIAVIEGRAAWFRHTQGMPGPGGTFDYWIVRAAASAGLEAYIGDWIRRHLRDYTGMLNVESIGGRIIEVHLRFADQWPDLYGNGWVEAVVRLYRCGEWEYADRERVDGYSVILFGPHGRTYRYPAPERLAAYRAAPEISSVQITFSDRRPPSSHSMPPGGFRLAVINSRRFEAARRLRISIANDFGLP